MRRAAALAVGSALGALGLHIACGGDDAASEPSADAARPDAGTAETGPDAGDPRCATQAILLSTHPHASQQPSPLGKTLSDVRGWHGSLYFGYGDLELNTGPIYLTSFDPLTKTWTEHTVAYDDRGTRKTTPAFYTHDIERFFPIGDALFAPAAQVDYSAPFDSRTGPEYAVGSATHEWTQVDISPVGLHVISAIERAPGDLYITGSGFMQTDASVAANGRPGSFVWRSQDGGPFTVLFPDFSYPEPQEFYDLSGSWAFGAALNGTAYLDVAGFVYLYDGKNWGFNAPVGGFVSPAVFAGRIVFATLDQFFAFDGTTRTNLDFRFFQSRGRYQGSNEPLVLFQVTENRLLAVRYGGDVMMTTDLESWTCIGKVPPDATSIGSLNGVVYFGSVDAQVYGFPSPSW